MAHYHALNAWTSNDARRPFSSHVILSLCTATALFFVGCSDVVESTHATIAAAKQNIDRGWIPAVLPASTVRIRESHDLDKNIGNGTFAFGAPDAEQFRSSLTALPSDAVMHRVKISRDRMEREGFSFYRHGDFYLAVNWSRRCGEFWLAYSQ